MVDNFNKVNLAQIRNDINIALRQVMEKHNIDLSLGNIAFTSAEFSVKLSAKVKNSQVLESREIQNLRLFGLPGDILNTEFNYAGVQYKIKGVNVRKRKNPIVIERVRDGKSFCGAVAMIKACLLIP